MTQAENEQRDSMGVTCVSASDCTGENTTGGQHACTSTGLCYSLNIITSISSGIEPRRKLKPRESEVSLVSPTRTAAWALCTRLDSPFGASVSNRDQAMALNCGDDVKLPNRLYRQIDN